VELLPDGSIRVGIDIVDVPRLRRLLSEQPDIAGTVFTERELSYCRGRRREDEHLAGRFAAKEAVLKAFGTGLGTRMRWTDVEIINELHGRPRVHLHGAVASWATTRGLRSVDVSLAHTEGVAVAQCVAVWEPTTGAGQ
jgi:holo-[acyl-carrier protein] synthase